MFASAEVDLALEQSWEPGRLLAEKFRWPVGVPLVRLDEVAEIITATVSPTEGVPVIVPSSLDAGVQRRVLKSLRPVYQVGETSGGLRPGDLLIPPLASQSVLLVTPAMVGSLVSGVFAAVRPGEDGLWIWASFNSASGVRMRTLALSAGAPSAGPRLRSLVRDWLIPWPPPSVRHEVAPRLRHISESIPEDEDEADTSWWRVADLTSMEWRLALATPHPEVLSMGIPLDQLATVIRRGSGRAPRDFVPRRPGDVPVADSHWLRVGEVRRWLSPDDPTARTRAEPGDVLVAYIGSYAYARIAEPGFVVDQNVYRIQLKQPALAPAIVHFLNSRTGLSLRRILTNDHIGVRRRDLGMLPVPESALAYSGEVDTGASLVERLEQALWS